MVTKPQQLVTIQLVKVVKQGEIVKVLTQVELVKLVKLVSLASVPSEYVSLPSRSENSNQGLSDEASSLIVRFLNPLLSSQLGNLTSSFSTSA